MSCQQGTAVKWSWTWSNAAKSNVNLVQRWFFPGDKGACHHLNFSAAPFGLSESLADWGWVAAESEWQHMCQQQAWHSNPMGKSSALAPWPSAAGEIPTNWRLAGPFLASVRFTLLACFLLLLDVFASFCMLYNRGEEWALSYFQIRVLQTL